MEYSVATFRGSGLDARWGRHAGVPTIFLRKPDSPYVHQRERWWPCESRVFATMLDWGISAGFDHHTLRPEYLELNG